MFRSLRKRQRARRGGRSTFRTRTFRPLRLEPLEARHLLANFTPSDVPGLIAAVNTANSNGQDDTINLGGNTFTLNVADNGDNGLPIIQPDNGNALTIENGTIERNTSAGIPQFRILRVANGAELTIRNSTISGGNTIGFGGGIFNDGTLTVTASTLSGNLAGVAGGGIYNPDGMLTVMGSTLSGNRAVSGFGGGIVNFSTLTVTGSTLAGNTASGDGGGIFTVGTLTVTSSTLSGNPAGGDGGGIYNRDGTLTVTSSTLSGNPAGGDGGGIYNRYGTLSVTASTISGNSATGSTGGGGIFSSGTLSVTASTISGNSATGSIGGGGIANLGGTLTVTASTLSGNRAVSGFGGGGIYNAGPLTVTGSTLSGNTASSGGGGGIYNSLGTLTVTGTIVTGSTGGDFGGAGGGSGSHNLSDDAGFPGRIGSTGVTGFDPVLRDNGGPTMTHALLPGSNAIDAGDNNQIPADTFDRDGDGNTTEPDPFDQRGVGFDRVVNGGSSSTVDIGAFEFAPPIVVTTAADENDGTPDPGMGAGTSLREAVIAANANPNVTTITFDPSLAGVPINLTMGQLSITEELGIRGLGADQTTIDAQGNSRIFDASGSNFDVTISGLTLTGGQTPTNEDGGAIRFGFLGSDNTGTLTVQDSTISGNSATGPVGDGGGIYTYSGSVSVSSSTISGNSAADDGGGIYTYSGAVNVTSSTISGNSADGDGDGGGINSGGEVTIDNSTITQNTATGAAGGINLFNDPATIRSSIIAGNTDDGTAPDIEDNGNTITISNSLIGDNTGSGLTEAQTPDAGGNLIGNSSGGGIIDPKLGPLASNGGATQTHALLVGSPAIDKGAAHGQTTDQRGVIRTFDQTNVTDGSGGATDMGAFELGRVVTTPTDENDGPGAGTGNSLRDAIIAANANPGAEEVFLPAETYLLTILGVDDTTQGGDLDITSERLIIRGVGEGNVFIDAITDTRVFEVFSGVTVEILGVTVRGGNVIAGNGDSNVGGGIQNKGVLTIADSTVSGNTSADDGGGIYNASTLTVHRSTISGNRTTGATASGGGIFNGTGDTLTVTATTFSKNTSNTGGGGIYNRGTATITDSTLSGNSGTAGGGIESAISGDTTVNRSTLSGNTASIAGGGIYNSNTLNVFNSTISGNEAGQDGGGIANRDIATAVVTNSTITRNSAENNGGGLRNASGGSVTLDSTIVDGNVAGMDGSDVHGSVTANFSLIGNSSSATIAGSDNVLNAAAMLGPLQNNGGPTQTHALLVGSPAIDQGNTNGQTSDQRSFGRTFDFPGVANGNAGATDIGAFEVGLVVTTADDELDADISNPNDLSLREAIGFANANAGGFDITFAPSLSGVPINLTMGQLSITEELGIRGLGADQTTIDAQGNSRIFDASGSNFDVTISGLTLTGGQTPTNEDGGAIRFGFLGSDNTGTLTVQDSTISGNSATGPGGDGGGIYTYSGSVSVTSSTISGNSATGGGGIRTFFGSVSVSSSTISGNSAADDGGGIYTGTGAVNVTSSTISGNSAADDGGGIYTYSGAVNVTSSTISGNSADGDGDGGGINSGGEVTIDNSTITQNTATGAAGGINLFNDPATIRSSIIAGNTDDGTAPDIEDNGNTITISNSLVGDNTGSGLTEAQMPDSDGNLIGTTTDPINPLLGPLGSNGGPTQTHAPLPGSPALNVGVANGQTTDQRGAPRDDGNGVDMGAFEFQADHAFVVNSAGDASDNDAGDGSCDDGSGNCTLRAAIQETNALANADPNASDMVFFDIAGTETIQPGGPLPAITESVVIDATSEPDFDAATGAPVVQIRGNSAGVGKNGLTIAAGGAGSTIRGLVINRFSGHGVVLAGSDGNTIAGNYIGTTSNGNTAAANGKTGVFVSGSDNNVVEGNLISGNTQQGVRISAGSSVNVLRGNLIGTNKDGTSALGNLHGVSVINAGANVIGGTTESARNVISGNTRYGVQVTGAGSAGTRVEGNLIGTDAAGSGDLGNAFQGVVLAAGATNIAIGGTATGAGNVISGNDKNGIYMAGGSDNVVQGNLIGLDADGAAALGNALRGVTIVGGGTSHTVGGTAAGAGNVISANGQHGVQLSGGSSGNTVQGNLIGTDVTGMLDRGNNLQAVHIINAPNNQIGGTAMTAGNVLSGNRRGVMIRGGSATGNVVEGNLIGADINGDPLGNTIEGIRVILGASSNTIGGAVAGAGNVIANNGGAANGAPGVVLLGGTGNAIRGNSILNNAGLGIDLDDNGITPNDPGDLDGFANDRQNFPVLQTAVSSGGMTTITGTLNSTPNSSFTVEFFSSPAADPSGNGEGETFLGSTTVDTDGNGDGNFSPTFSVDVPSGHVVTATATDSAGNTSEFSAAVTVADGSPLLAAGGEAGADRVGGSALRLTHPTLAPVAYSATQQFVAAGFSSELFSNVEFAIADLPGATLGLTTGNTIAIDVNAAGNGWLVSGGQTAESREWDETDFSNRKSQIKNQESIDLLTVVMHELGHVAGLPDLYDPAYEDDLMYAWLESGQRKTEAAALSDVALAAFGEH